MKPLQRLLRSLLERYPSKLSNIPTKTFLNRKESKLQTKKTFKIELIAHTASGEIETTCVACNFIRQKNSN